MDLLPENAEVLDLYYKLKAFGPETVFGLTDLRLSPIEAEDLMETLSGVDAIIAEIRASVHESK